MSRTGKFISTGLFLALSPLVSMQAAGEDVSVTCLVEPSEEMNVGTQVDGTLEEVLVGRGDVVSRGQLLARLNSGVEAAAVEYQAAKTQFAARRYARNEDLQKQQLVSTNDLDEMGTELRMSNST
ncbi:MAG: biotin/lipoyl-binding protein [Nitrosomonadales bacterium]|nr:biotin/lipoyl-binding protein [Nitrosomonadales bacterium]